MRKLIPAVLMILVATAVGVLAASGETTSIAGKWTMSMNSPHGPIEGPLEVKQDGTKITGTYDAKPFGSMPISGKVDGKTVTFVMEVKGGEVKVEFTGTVDGAKMSGTASEHIGAWTATRQ